MYCGAPDPEAGRPEGRGRERSASDEEDGMEGLSPEGRCGPDSHRTGLPALHQDCLEMVACALPLHSASLLALHAASWPIRSKLSACPAFWRRLVHSEGLQHYSALRTGDPAGGPERRSLDGERLHSAVEPVGGPQLERVWRRGLAMRRNLVAGRFELWRMFLTGAEHLPVVRMETADPACSSSTLAAAHCSSPFLRRGRNVRTNRYWNEQFLVVLQQHVGSHGPGPPPGPHFNDMFVWGWRECQQPSKDLQPTYPHGLFPTAFFLHKHYLVMMPDVAGGPSSDTFTSLIRVHDLSSPEFFLLGGYSLPVGGAARRLRGGGGEAAHLHRAGERAIALCRTPGLTLYVFQLPDCALLASLRLHTQPSFSFGDIMDAGGIDQYDLDQRHMVRDGKILFFFHHPDFFDHMFQAEGPLEEEAPPVQERTGCVLEVGVKEAGKGRTVEVELLVGRHFDTNREYIEKAVLVDEDRLLLCLSSGRLELRRVARAPGPHPGATDLLASMELLHLDCPEPLQPDYDLATEEDLEQDGPTLGCALDASLIVTMRHFKSGRCVHAYSVSQRPTTGLVGELLYTFPLDRPGWGLEPRPGYLGLELDGRFLCAAAQQTLVLWDSRTGRHLRNLLLPHHYTWPAPDEEDEDEDRFAWKGHNDFAFTEDGTIIIHSTRRGPVAADVLLFW